MRWYAAGWQASNGERIRAVIDSGHLQYRCLSFANLEKLPGFPYYSAGAVEDLRVCEETGIGIMMDSGVFSYRTHTATLIRTGKGTKKLIGEEDYIRRYVEWCRRGGRKWDFYVTLDIIKDSADIYSRHLVLEKMGVRPMPVFHGDDSLDYLRKYADRGYTYICIGEMQRNQIQDRRYLDGVFALGERLKLSFHGLAVTTPWKMLEYPFFSVDSSSWSRVAGYGSIVTYDQKTSRLSTVHVSVESAKGAIANKKTMAAIQAHVEAEGFNWEQLRTDFVLRHCYNARTMSLLAATATKKHKHSVGGWRHLF